ncbi:Hpt domain-containing protein [Vibrio parahaemolyticus]|nr:Hpt domain-containing protein [Vibrio parahaemolyticus]EHK9581722.1 Hpt domain-containing protein [Vibrio parahaemolyticus]EIZ1896662.1 Hpt domain-containing protein [Vibrio parahaemolyticus]EKO5157798.1 Hpt domain-containing protein [Vibrio parahaemolyticus]
MINFELLNQYMDNDVDIIIAVFSTYLEDYSDATEQLNKMFVQQNWPELYLMAHSLKGILEGFGEDTAVVALEKIETSTRNNTEPECEDITIVSSELVTIKKQIFAYLENLK